MIFFISSLVVLFYSCGFANYNFAPSNSDVTVLDSRSSDDFTGEFNSPKGRLESSDTCSKSEDCKALCDSMLQRFSLQKKCYDYKEVEVQSFRDTYNLLALGNPRKLGRVDTEKMEKFLTFGPELWRDAIYGFERQRKENCAPPPPPPQNLPPPDPTERENCRLPGYYKQVGYWSAGAVSALEWLAKNDWLAELIVRHDEHLVIMTSLLEVLANGGGQAFQTGDSDRETTAVKNETCNLPADLQIGFDSYNFSVEEDKQYEAFGANCVGKGEDSTGGDVNLNYFIIAVKDKNKHSLNLGYQVVDKLCDDATDATDADRPRRDDCIKHFFCNIKEKEKDTDTTVLSYMNEEKGSISGFKHPGCS